MGRERYIRDDQADRAMWSSVLIRMMQDLSAPVDWHGWLRNSNRHNHNRIVLGHYYDAYTWIGTDDFLSVCDYADIDRYTAEHRLLRRAIDTFNQAPETIKSILLTMPAPYGVPTDNWHDLQSFWRNNASEQRTLAGYSERLRVALEKSRLSKRALSARSGVHHTHITAFLNGKRRPNEWLLDKLAETLNVSADWLKYGTCGGNDA